MVTVGSLFSGIGGIDYAFQAAGFAIAYQVEIDEYCQKTLQKHWPEVQRHTDIFDIDAGTLPATDVITAGFPCQPFSVAGNQRGEDDDRYLWPEIIRFVTAKRPRVVFLENVPGLRTIDGGATFKRILRELAKIGYDAQWHHLRASDVAAPHTRERIFIVAYTQSSGSNWRQRQQRNDGASGNQNGGHSRIRSNGGNKFMAYRSTKRRGQRRNHRERRHLLHNQNRNAAQGKSEWQGWQRGVISTNQAVGDTVRPRLAQRQGFRRYTRQERPTAQQAGNATGKQVASQPRLGRVADGLSSRLDRHQFPAPPGSPYEWEPARTTTQTKNRTARIKALGNAVVPQCVYPIALAIKDYLEGSDE